MVQQIRLQAFLVLLCLLVSGRAAAEVVTRLPATGQVAALTFDACETSAPSHFDQRILEFLVAKQIPCTIFLSGKFMRRNGEEIKRLARQYPFIEFENHSLTHHQHMERLAPEQVRREVMAADEMIISLTGRKPLFFRFPAGNYDARALAQVESLGYRVVHWTFPSGDPDRKITSQKLASWVLSRTRPGSILIFHINGRGYHTGEALPGIVRELRRQGYRFVRLDEALPPARP
jgi:peptidoglycan/xylan/chitin deacetylase (PgdA/CDA1 family)